MAELLIASQNEVSTRITNMVKNSIDKVGKDKLTANHFENRIRLPNQYWSDYMTQHKQLLAHKKDVAAADYFNNDLFETDEHVHSEALHTLTEKLKELSIPPSVVDASAASGERVTVNATPVDNSVPRIKLPTFSGKQSEWESFRNRFTALISQHRFMPKSTKLQHLLDALHGDAAQRLKGIQIVDSNYDLASERLNRRYDNKTIRLATHLE